MLIFFKLLAIALASSEPTANSSEPTGNSTEPTGKWWFIPEPTGEFQRNPDWFELKYLK